MNKKAQNGQPPRKPGLLNRSIGLFDMLASFPENAEEAGNAFRLLKAMMLQHGMKVTDLPGYVQTSDDFTRLKLAIRLSADFEGDLETPITENVVPMPQKAKVKPNRPRGRPRTPKPTFDELMKDEKLRRVVEKADGGIYYTRDNRHGIKRVTLTRRYYGWPPSAEKALEALLAAPGHWLNAEELRKVMGKKQSNSDTDTTGGMRQTMSSTVNKVLEMYYLLRDEPDQLWRVEDKKHIVDKAKPFIEAHDLDKGRYATVMRTVDGEARFYLIDTTKENINDIAPKKRKA